MYDVALFLGGQWVSVGFDLPLDQARKLARLFPEQKSAFLERNGPGWEEARRNAHVDRRAVS